MKSFVVVLAVLTLNSATGLAMASKPLEVWCGAPSKNTLSGFPYTTSIRIVTKKVHGRKTVNHNFEVATVYKNGRVVATNYVYKTTEGMGMSYRSADNEFALNMATQTALDSTAAFRAVIHERDGDTMIANGEFPCHRPKSIVNNKS